MRWDAAALVTVLLGSPAAFAQGRDPTTGQAMFDQAREAMKKGDHVRACPKFAESQRLDPQPGTLANLAVCEEKRGTVASAWTHAREAIEQLGAGDDRVPALRALVSRTEKRLPKLVVRLGAGAPRGTRVRRDEIELGEASLGEPLPVDPGEHTVVVTSPGRKDATFRAAVAEAATAEISVSVGEPIAVDPPPGPAAASASKPDGRESAPPVAPRSSGTAQSTIGYVARGVGVIGVGLGVFEALRQSSLHQGAQSCHDDPSCPNSTVQSKNADARSANTLSLVGFVAGGILVVGGVVLIVAAPSDNPAGVSANRVTIAPTITRGGASLGMLASFLLQTRSTPIMTTRYVGIAVLAVGWLASACSSADVSDKPATGGAGGAAAGGAGATAGAAGAMAGGAGGGGAGTGGQSGAGGACPPPPAPILGTCDPVVRCGCAPAQNCVIVSGQSSVLTSCIPAGTVPNGDKCAIDQSCLSGSGCFEGVCAAYCYKNQDCLGAYSQCIPINGVGVKFGVCNVACDPTAPTSSASGATPCGAGVQCVSLGASGVTTCVSAKPTAGGTGATCTFLNECLPGLICAGQKCAPYCFVGQTGICTAGKKCVGLGSAVFYAGHELGACF